MAQANCDWKTDRFCLGACYYPEHWPEELWADDFRRMRELGFSIVRMAEFAWSIFEPEEGRFEFGLFDRAIDLAREQGIQVILGTPTATPPAWLTSKYPEVLNAKQDGTLYRHGQRRHYNYNSPVYRELSARIVTRMAEHYKDHPAVVGWQIDNELNCEVNVFYSDADHAAFRVWLREKYGSLEVLNRAWGAVFWNQTYTDWSQVHLTRPTPSDSPNPHQALDEKRFFSDSAIAFAKLQSDILRDAAPRQWVTTNGMFGHLDSHKMTEETLDFFSYDSYPNFSTIYPDKGERPLLDRKWSLNLSAARDVSPNFCVMEQQSGPGGWVNMMDMPSPKPGQMRLWTYQSIAHGADMLLYFRWRTAAMGTEIYWHGINDYHNQPNRRVAEAGIIGEELARVGAQWLGSTFRAEVAILKDYDNEWDGELDKWHGPFTGRSVSAWFKALQRRHIPVDTKYVRASTTIEELAKYRVLVYPHPAVMPKETAALLKRYVEGGGTLVLGCRSGYKDAAGQCYMQPFPGPLSGMCGIQVEDFTLIGPYQQAPQVKWNAAGAGTLPGDGFADILRVTAESAEILAVYASDYYAGKPALVRNRQGEGTAYYYGSVFTEESAGALIKVLGLQSPASEWGELPEGVELAIREHHSNGNKFAFLLNYAHDIQTLTFRKPLRDLLSGTEVHGSVAMKPFDVLVLELDS
ncbi:beta-galactosidase [Cohnella candidum]|uniref:Beta-galactosidase n=1 Tax=Cohnella candidum TaxID=2674991 RepID=A0A3G3JXW9_9BACL|nr:beta-galactosidase [Cohnella candidum]AYQ73023.1 beta-galactosidase [Cohnella candidum]